MYRAELVYFEQSDQFFVALNCFQPPITRKQTLIRGVALEGTSPPPESFLSQIPPNGTLLDSHLLTHGATGTSEKNGKKKGQSHEAKEFLLASHKISNVRIIYSLCSFSMHHVCFTESIFIL